MEDRDVETIRERNNSRIKRRGIHFVSASDIERAYSSPRAVVSNSSRLKTQYQALSSAQE